MSKRGLPAEPAMQRTIYGNFKGVDFSADPRLVDKGRSPYALNIIPDSGGQPEKRLGWRVLHTIEQPVNALAYGCINGAETFIAHGGTKLYRWDINGTTVIRDGINNAKSVIFFAQHENKSKLFILTGREYLVYDGSAVKDVTEIAKVPTILIGKAPNGGGATLNPVNLLQSKRIETFYGTETDTVYQLAANSLDAAAVTVRKMNVDGVLVSLAESTDFTVDRITGKITFIVSPGKPPLTEQPNIEIAYSKTVEGYADRIRKCTVFAYYGLGGSNRIFVTRNPDLRANDWWCEIGDPTYFPDINYAVIGTENTAVMGYSKIGEYLVIIKEDNQQDTTIFIRSAQLQNGTAAFPIKPGITGIGAISPYSFASLIDEPLFLSRQGVYAITSNVVTAERTLQNRSFFVDNRLKDEPNLQNAVATEWDGYYMVAVNGNAYLLNSRQKSEGKNPSDYFYSCYLWDNIHATCFLVHDGVLYFGAQNGQICKFNTDDSRMSRFSDNGQPITAIWSTKMDDDGSPELYKTMSKRGSGITPKPFARTTLDVAYITPKSDEQLPLKTIYYDIFDLDDIDFNRFTFNTSTSAKFFPFLKKVKKYEALQIVVRNNVLNEGFGMLNVVKSYSTAGQIKR